ncbi:MAG: glycosyltransferase family 39 protein [Ruminiclostridium sp.]|nr:glycosyltransferase family 39 protein [Ruminiclostridium sp.]
MEQFVKKTITLVFCIFAIITSLLFIISEEFSMENLLFPIVIITISCILAKFPYLYRVKIERPIVALLVISFLALSIRIIWVSLVQVTPESDFYTYHTLSQNILQNNVSNSVFVSLFPHVFGFSKVLSFFYAIFGSNPITAVYFNIVLSIGILILLYYLGKNLIDANTGLAAAAIYAFWPSQIFSIHLFSQSLYIHLGYC